MIVLAGILAGLLMIFKADRRVKVLEELEAIARSLNTSIRYTNAPIDELLCEMQEAAFCGEFLQNYARLCKAEDNFHAAWEKTCNVCVNPKDMAAVLSFGEKLGASDSVGQQECIHYFLECITVLLMQARAQKEKCQRVKLTLCSSAAMAVALLLV